MKNLRWFEARPFLSIIAIAVALTLMVGVCSYYVMRFYQTLLPIWVEQAAYSQAPMVKFGALMREGGFWHAISLMKGERHILQLIILGSFAPKFLVWFHAPLLAVLPTFTVFLCLFGWTVYQRIGHLGYSTAAMFLFCSIAQFLYHAWGVGSGFADWQSMFLLSAAALCLINALMSPGIFWVRWFSVLVSLAVLARITATFYVVVICGPMIIIYLIEQFKREGSIKKIGVTILNVLVIILPTTVIVVAQLAVMLLYYGSVNAWQLHQPFFVSLENIFTQLLLPFMGVPLILVCAALFLFQMYMGFHRARKFGNSEIAIVWWIIGYLGFLLAYGYTSDVPKEVMYVVPALLLASAAPIWMQNENTTFYKPLSSVLAVFTVILFSWNFYHNIEQAKWTTSERTAVREVQYEMARIISSLPSPTVWQSYTKVDWGIPVSLLTQYEFEEYRQYGGTDFYNNKSYWDTWYPNLTIDELQNKLYNQMINCVDAAVILKDPDIQPSEMEDYSYTIAAFIARNIKADLNWEFVEEMDGWPSGTRYQIYRNIYPELARVCKK